MCDPSGVVGAVEDRIRTLLALLFALAMLAALVFWNKIPHRPRPTPAPSYPVGWLHPLTLQCPEETTRFVQRLPAELRQDPTEAFPQRDEFCLDQDFKRHGPYARWGPNGERLVAGEYRHGVKDGVWSTWTYGQRHDTAWRNGARGETSTDYTSTPGDGVFDFRACAPHTRTVDNSYHDAAFTYSLQPKDQNTCVLSYYSDDSGPGLIMGPMEPPPPPIPRVCDVPRSLGKVTYYFDHDEPVPYDHLRGGKPVPVALWKCRRGRQ
jgi:hypothetical protein